MVKWSFWTPNFISPFKKYHNTSSTNYFIIGTIHKHQNFKKLTQQVTTKQSLVELIQNHKSYKTKRSVSHNPKSEACITHFWNIFKKKYPYIKVMLLSYMYVLVNNRLFEKLSLKSIIKNCNTIKECMKQLC